jgi:hypothetical protein
MVKESNDRVESLLESAGPGTARPAPPQTRTVRVQLCEGPVELRVPRVAGKSRHRRRHIKEIKPDATPC